VQANTAVIVFDCLEIAEQPPQSPRREQRPADDQGEAEDDVDGIAQQTDHPHHGAPRSRKAPLRTSFWRL
jgi:hypothetical protein